MGLARSLVAAPSSAQVWSSPASVDTVSLGRSRLIGDFLILSW
jgi:hypothetical protein